MRFLFFKNVSVLMAGTIVAQIINLLFIPILTRIFTPEEFGLYAIFNALASIYLVVTTLKMENSIYLADNTADLNRLLSTLVKSALILSFIIGVLIVLGAQNIYSKIPLEGQHFYLALLTFFYLATKTLQMYFFNHNIRNRKYSRAALSRVCGTVAMVCVTVVLSTINTSYYVLIAGVLSSAFVSLVILVDANVLYKSFKLKMNFVFFKSFWRFPVFLVPASAMELFCSQAYIVGFARFFSDETLGQLGAYHRCVNGPTSIVDHSFLTALKEALSSKLKKKEPVLPTITKAALALTCLSAIPGAVLYFYGPEIFAIVLGSDWRVAGEYAQILLPMYILGLIVSPISVIFYMVDKQNIDLYMQILTLGLILFCLYMISSTKLDIHEALYLYSALYSLKYFVQGVIVFSLAKSSDLKLVNQL